MSTLADRIRGIVAPRVAGADPSAAPDSTVAHGVSRAAAAPMDPCAGDDNIEQILGGAWQDAGGGRCFVVDRRWEPSAMHGRERIGALAERLERAAGEASLFSAGASARAPFVFFDLETTGLSGGAGTLAFLVGCGWFEADGSFVTRQFLLTRHADERLLLERVAGELARAGALVSFNGKSFDAPLLEGRYLFHRLPWRGRELPHVDVLHPARRFWKPVARTSQGRDRRAESHGLAGESCSLQALEKQLIGLRRTGDTPGFEIPALYFRFVRGGAAAPLRGVLEHNRLDLLTLAALTARLFHLAQAGPDDVSDPREALALGDVYARSALDDRARASYQRALDRCRSPRAAYDPVRIDALRALAHAWRRARRHEEAASCWRELVEVRGCPACIAREASEALAIHHEHRLRDLESARAFALRSLESGSGPVWVDAVRYRLDRLERKMGRKAEVRSQKYELKFEAEADA